MATQDEVEAVKEEIQSIKGKIVNTRLNYSLLCHEIVNNSRQFGLAHCNALISNGEKFETTKREYNRTIGRELHRGMASLNQIKNEMEWEKIDRMMPLNQKAIDYFTLKYAEHFIEFLCILYLNMNQNNY